MKVLFDANTPAPLARFLRGHEVSRADVLGWQGLVNGELLRAAVDFVQVGQVVRFDVPQD